MIYRELREYGISLICLDQHISKLSDTVKGKKRWFLRAELAVLVCVVCIWVIMLVTVDIESTKAAVLKQVVKIRTNSADAHLNLGNAYFDLGNYEGAIEAYKKAIRIDPNWPRPYISLSFLFIYRLGTL